MARDPRDSFSEAVTSLLHSGKVRFAVGTLLISTLSAATAVAGKIASWAFSEPWKTDETVEAAKTDAERAKVLASATETRLQKTEYALWRAVVVLGYETHCEDQTAQGRAACVNAALQKFQWNFDAAVSTLEKSRAEVAADKSLELIQPALPKTR